MTLSEIQKCNFLLQAYYWNLMWSSNRMRNRTLFRLNKQSGGWRKTELWQNGLDTLFVNNVRDAKSTTVSLGKSALPTRPIIEYWGLLVERDVHWFTTGRLLSGKAPRYILTASTGVLLNIVQIF